MEGESKKKDMQKGQHSSHISYPMPSPRRSKTAASKAKPGFDEASVGHFFFLIHFRTCHLGYEAETEGNLLGFFLTVTAALCSKHLHYLEISGYLCSCCYQK